MHWLDVRTVLLGYAISNGICALVMAFLWRQNRARYTGLDFWLGCFILHFMGIALIALRDLAPDWITIVIANSLLASGIWLLYIGLERFLDRPTSQIYNYFLLASFFFIEVYFTFIQPSLAIRYINAAVAQFVICAECLWLVAYRAEADLRPASRRLALSFASICLVCLVSIVFNIVFPSGDDLLQANIHQVLALLGYQMAFVALTFSLILLVNRRLLMESIRDISARQRAQRALDESERGARNIFENVPIGMFQSTPQGKLIYSNPAFSAIFGYASPAELIEIVNRSSIAEVLYEQPQRRPLLVEEVEQAAGGWRTFENRYRRKDGRIIDAVLTFCALPDMLTTQTNLYGFVQDITEAKQIEQAVQERDHWLRLAQEAAHAGTWHWNLRTNKNIWSESLFKLYGLEPYSCQPTFDVWLNTILPEDRLAAAQTVQQAAATGAELTAEWRVCHPDGKIHWLMSRGQPVRDAHNQADHYIGIVFDVSERKQAEEAMRALSNRYAALLDTVPDIIAEVDRNKVYTWVNQAGRQFFGEQALGREAAFYFEGEQDTYQIVQPLFDGRNDVIYVESWQRRQDGEKRLLAWRGRAIFDAAGNVSGALSTAHDITERKRAEQTLRESEEKYRELFESSLIGIFRTSRQGKYLLVNPAYAHILGYRAPEELIHSMQDISAQVYFDPAERDQHLAALDRQGEISYESRLRRKDGRMIYVRVDDRAVRGPNGEILYYQGAVIDITEQRQADDRLKALLEEKETLLREVHHRVKNNLQAIVYLIEMQSAHLGDEAGQKFLKELEGQTRAMSLVYEQVYQSPNLAQVNMVSYLEKLVDNVLIAFARGRAVQLHLDLSPLTLNVDQAMPCGLIVNELVTNSLKYAFPPAFAGQPALAIRLFLDGERVRLSVGDNGLGLPAGLDWQTSRSSGLRLARLWATHQLGGEMVSDGDSGLSFHISFKKSG